MDLTLPPKMKKYFKKFGKPEVRYLADLKKVLYNQGVLKTAKNFEVYYIYRGIKKKNGLRCDLTILPAKMLGEEFAKTKGHQHSNNYQELYIVLSGQALFLIQKYQNKKIKDAYYVKAKKGEGVIIPPGYGHITINPGKLTLKMVNWISEKCKNDYRLFEKKMGGCYYYTKKGWIKNKNYDKIAPLRFKKPLKKIPTNLDFLK